MNYTNLDGTVVDPEGKIMFFSPQRFERDIVLGACCFICGAAPSAKIFNDEHVIPEWILRRFRLFDKMMGLPNRTGIRYGQNKVPCCVDCNCLLSRELEQPMQRLIDRGVSGIPSQLPSALPTIFRWLCLTFFKTHYRDRQLRMERDRRAADTRIGDIYHWPTLHHMHAVARSVYTGCTIEPAVIGSIFVFETMSNDPLREPFDYADIYDAQTVMIRLGDVAIVSVLNDSCAAFSAFWRMCERITGAVNGLQLREISAHLAAINLHLEKRPEYEPSFDLSSGKCSIAAKSRTPVALHPYNSEVLGDLMHTLCGEIIRLGSNDDKEDMLASIKAGKYTFLFNEDGSFNDSSIFVAKQEDPRIG